MYMRVKLRPVIDWFYKKKKEFFFWVEDTNLFLFFLRKFSIVYCFYFLLMVLKINIIFSLFITHIANRFVWDILTTWYYVDYFMGIVYKYTDDLKPDKKSLKLIKNYMYILIIFLINYLNKYIINPLIIYLLNIYTYISYIFNFLKIKYICIYIYNVYKHLITINLTIFLIIKIFNYNYNYINLVFSIIIYLIVFEKKLLNKLLFKILNEIYYNDKECVDFYNFTKNIIVNFYKKNFIYKIYYNYIYVYDYKYFILKLKFVNFILYKKITKQIYNINELNLIYFFKNIIYNNLIKLFYFFKKQLNFFILKPIVFLTIVIRKIITIILYKLKIAWNFIYNWIVDTTKYFIKQIYSFIISSKLYKYILKTYLDIIEFFKNQYNIIFTENNILEYKIYIYNKKSNTRLYLYKLNLMIIYILDNLEYKLLNKEKIYKKRNISKFFKKKKSFKKFNSKFELEIKNFYIKLYKDLIVILNNFIEINKAIINIYSIYFDYIKIIKIPKLKKIQLPKFKLSIKLDIIKLNKIISYLYSPITILNFIISDIALSITYTLIYFKKKYYINIIVIFIYTNLYKIIIYILYKIKFIKFYFVKYIKKISYTLISKTIYVTFIISYFYNKEFSQILFNDLYNTYIFDIIKDHNISNFINFILNSANLYYLTLIIGLQIVLYWSKNVHRFFGKYLWTATIFPALLETHKILYYKLFCVNLLTQNTFEYILLIRYDLLSFFNYKIFNIYIFLSNIILLMLIYFFIKKGAFKHIYANFKYSRWKFIKYPVFIYIIECLRFKILEYLTSFILYLNYKWNLNFIFLKTIIKVSNNKIILIIIDFIQEYIYEIYKFDYTLFYRLLIPNLYFINFLIDLTLIIISLLWTVNYSNKYLKIDSKFVAAPVVVIEKFIKYSLIYYFSYYFLKYTYIWSLDGTIIWYGFQSIVFIYIYLEMRVHKIPRKTMPWYFRQIVELWPSTYMNQWYTSEYLYIDQQKYILLRLRVKEFKIGYKDLYKQLEIWHKAVVLSYQKDKDIVTRQLSAYCRMMARKENMMRELNNFEYQGWYDDWHYNSHKINIYNWKLDLWDKPYMYQFKKTVFFSNIRFHYFGFYPSAVKYASKYMHLTYLFFITNLFDYYYTQKYIFILEKEDIATFNRLEWKKYVFTEYDSLEELVHLKKLKIVLMSFSSGENIKTPDWIFPPRYEKQYKLKGWEMFEDPRIDAISEADWTVDLKDFD